MTDISVVGLGDMGSALAHILLKNGYSVTAWNRSAEALGASSELPKLFSNLAHKGMDAGLNGKALTAVIGLLGES